MKKIGITSALMMMVTSLPLVAQVTLTPNIGLQVPYYQQTNWQVTIQYDLNRLDLFLSGNLPLPNLTVTNLPGLFAGLTGCGIIGYVYSPASNTCVANGTAPFSSVTGGTNTAAAMIVGTGSTLGTTGAGSIAATSAAALLNTPSLCSTGYAPVGILSNGNATGCTALVGISLTTTGTSGASTLISGVLNIPQYANNGLSGMTAGQLPVALTPTTVANSIPYATAATASTIVERDSSNNINAAMFNGTPISWFGIGNANIGGSMPSAVNTGNTAVGTTALTNANGGASYNTAVGYEALSSTSSGEANTGLGFNTVTYGSTDTNETMIGYNAVGKGSNTVTLGNNSVTAVYMGNTLIGPNASTTGTAANLSGMPTLPNGTMATTQTAGDNSTKLATDAFVLANAGSSGGGCPLTGCTFTGALNGTSASFSGTVAAGTSTPTTIGPNGVLLNGVPALQSQTSLNNYYSGGAGNLTGTGSFNTANGAEALSANTTGNSNTANGSQALYYNTTGSYNIANGYGALYYNTTGSDNTANGSRAGMYIEDGVTANQTSSNSVYEGFQAYPLASGDTNETVIGYAAIGHGSNTVTLGNSSTTALYMGNTLIGGSGMGTTSGTATLVSGTVTVSSTAACAVSSSCHYSLTRYATNSSVSIGNLSVGTISAGSSFVINSLTVTATIALTDVSSVSWQVN